MKRVIVLDTETTGINPDNGDRVIEIGCVEVVDGRQTGRQYQWYIHPECSVPSEVVRVHGITDEFLQDKPVFSEIAGAFCDCIRGAEIVAHNAPFDITFLDAELKRIGLPPVSQIAVSVTDSLKLARKRFPKQRNTLDHLCERFQIDRSKRTVHGALLDAQLLAEVYLILATQPV